MPPLGLCVTCLDNCEIEAKKKQGYDLYDNAISMWPNG